MEKHEKHCENKCSAVCGHSSHPSRTGTSCTILEKPGILQLFAFSSLTVVRVACIVHWCSLYWINMVIPTDALESCSICTALCRRLSGTYSYSLYIDVYISFTENPLALVPWFVVSRRFWDTQCPDGDRFSQLRHAGSTAQLGPV